MKLRLPAGVATLIGALPGATVLPPEAARPAAGLPSAPTLDLLGGTLAPSFEPVIDFLHSLAGRVEPVVVSLTGPVTVELHLLEEGFDPRHAAEEALTAVGGAADRLLSLVAEVLPEAPVVMLLEEPGLVNSMHPAFPLRSAHIEGMLRRIVAPLEGDAMVGVHVNGRADWEALFRSGIEVLAAPITAGLEMAADDLGRFLADGGFVAWGAVPVDEPLGDGAERQWARLSSFWNELTRLGLDPLVLRQQSIITPAADLGNFGVSQAERVLRITAELGQLVLGQVRGSSRAAGAGG